MALLLALLAAPLAAAPQAAFVIDARTGEVLHAENADARLHPASLTKMMTLYLAFEAVERGEVGLDDLHTVSAKAAAEPGSRLGLAAGQRIALRHLVRAVAVKSANDAATALAEAIAGSEAAFVARMNARAADLGLSATAYANAHGLTAPGHLTTARDMTRLGRLLRFHYPDYWNLFSRLSVDAGPRQVLHTNRRFLSAYAGSDGVKTGYTRAAGYNLTGSAMRGGKWLIGTVMGQASSAARAARMSALFDAGFARVPEEVRPVPPSPPARPVPALPQVLVAAAPLDLGARAPLGPRAPAVATRAPEAARLGGAAIVAVPARVPAADRPRRERVTAQASAPPRAPAAAHRAPPPRPARVALAEGRRAAPASASFGAAGQGMRGGVALTALLFAGEPPRRR
jgi:D-alanyl-D-alanine carboxypeptidase